MLSDPVDTPGRTWEYGAGAMVNLLDRSHGRHPLADRDTSHAHCSMGPTGFDGLLLGSAARRRLSRVALKASAQQKRERQHRPAREQESCVSRCFCGLVRSTEAAPTNEPQLHGFLATGCSEGSVRPGGGGATGAPVSSTCCRIAATRVDAVLGTDRTRVQLSAGPPTPKKGGESCAEPAKADQGPVALDAYQTRTCNSHTTLGVPLDLRKASSERHWNLERQRSDRAS